MVDKSVDMPSIIVKPEEKSVDKSADTSNFLNASASTIMNSPSINKLISRKANKKPDIKKTMK